MIDVVYELSALVAKFDQRGIEYALCGGVAMGVHGFMRMTMDIDFLVPQQSLDEVMRIAEEQGYTIRGKDLSFKNGAIEIRGISKIDAENGDVLPLDFLLVTPAIESVWQARLKADWQGGQLSIVSREGLIELKNLRGSAQDAVDISRLLGEEDHA